MSIAPSPIRLSLWGKVIISAILVVLGIWLFRSIGPAASPFVGAAITAYVFSPLIRWLAQRTRVSRAVWILALYFLVGVCVYVLLQVVGPKFTRQVHELQMQLPHILRAVQEQLATNQVVVLGGITVDLGPVERPAMDLLSEFGRTVPEMVPHLFATAIESVVLFLTYLLVTFYFLLEGDTVIERGYRLIPELYRNEIRNLGHQVDQVLSGYIRGTLMLIPIMAVVTYIVLSILGVRYALVLGIATGVLEIIPLVGPWSAALIAMSVALFQATTPFGWNNAVFAGVIGVIYFVLRMSEDNFIIPYVVGHAVHLHPVLVLFAILAGGALGGPFGLFISIPTVAVVRILLRYLYRKLVDAPEPPVDAPPAAAVVAPPVPKETPPAPAA